MKSLPRVFARNLSVLLGFSVALQMKYSVTERAYNTAFPWPLGGKEHGENIDAEERKEYRKLSMLKVSHTCILVCF